MKTVGLYLAIGLIAALGTGVLTIEVRRRMEPLLPLLPINDQVKFLEIDYLIAATAERIAQTASKAVRALNDYRPQSGRDPPP